MGPATGIQKKLKRYCALGRRLTFGNTVGNGLFFRHVERTGVVREYDILRIISVVLFEHQAHCFQCASGMFSQFYSDLI